MHHQVWDNKKIYHFVIIEKYYIYLFASVSYFTRAYLSRFLIKKLKCHPLSLRIILFVSYQKCKRNMNLDIFFTLKLHKYFFLLRASWIMMKDKTGFDLVRYVFWVLKYFADWIFLDLK